MRAPVSRIPTFVAWLLLAACEPAADVDHYVLALSWQPAFCERNPAKPECRDLDGGDFAAANLSLHGLWPNAADGEHPFYCEVAAGDRGDDEAGAWCDLPATGADAQTQADLEAVMPGHASCLDRHEWIKHGTCSGLDGDAYFDASIRLVRDVQATALARLLRESVGRQVPLRRMIHAFEQDFGAGAGAALVITCRRDGGRAYLAEIRLALHRDATGKPLARNALFLDGPAPHGGCPADIVIDRAE